MTAKPNPLAQKLIENVGSAIETYALPRQQRGISGINLISYARRSYLKAHSDADQEILDFMVDFDSRISSQVPYAFLRQCAKGAFTIDKPAILATFSR